MKMGLFRRTKFIVQREMQFRFARFVVLFTCGSALFTGLTVFYTTYLMLGERLADVYPQGRLMMIVKNAHLAMIINLALVMPVIYFISIRFSHRIAGPLPKIYQAIKSIGEGNYDVKLVLRKKDELQELATLINETANKLKEKQQSK
jgi:signal transduction histidine kinase